MARYLLVRLAYAVLVIFGAVTIIFGILHLVPGDPAAIFAGPNASLDQIAQVRHDLHLDEPLYYQYGKYLQGLVTGNFGHSYRLGVGAMSAVWGRVPATA